MPKYSIVKPGISSGGKGGKIIFLSGVVVSIIVVFFGYLASLANNFVITAP